MEPYKELEQKYASWVNSEFGVSCNSGTAALHLALLALGIGPGDEVILPDYTMAACGFAVAYTGATPVFVDVSIRHYALDISEVKKAITPKTKAIMVVHIYGRVVDLKPFKELGIPIIEDACEAHGAVDGSIADITCWSFYKNKIVHGEEGGMATTNNLSYAEWMHYYKNMAFSKQHDYFHRHIGYNYRMPNAQAKLILESLFEYYVNAAERRIIEGWYDDALGLSTWRDAVWFYDLEVDNPSEIINKHPGIRLGFKPLSSFPMWGGKGKPNATAISEKVVLLPVVPGMREEEVKQIAEIIWKR